jgi:hypothetical protein
MYEKLLDAEIWATFFDVENERNLLLPVITEGDGFALFNGHWKILSLSQISRSTSISLIALLYFFFLCWQTYGDGRLVGVRRLTNNNINKIVIFSNKIVVV